MRQQGLIPASPMPRHLVRRWLYFRVFFHCGTSRPIAGDGHPDQGLEKQTSTGNRLIGGVYFNGLRKATIMLVIQDTTPHNLVRFEIG